MYRIPETVRSTHSPDGAILLDLARGRVLQLNPTGSRIFQALTKRESESQIAEQLSTVFRVSHETANNDINEFLHLLQKEGLLQITASKVL